jgi:hypothetical protein
MVRFDDVSEKECSSALFRVEKVHTTLWALLSLNGHPMPAV